MGAALFYHLTRQPFEAVLPAILGKARQAGWRVVVRGRDRERMEWLDEKLWLGPEEGFLPHGLAGGPHDAEQPVLLTVDREAPNDAACLVSVDGAEVGAEEVAALERTCILFDGGDAAATERARGQWRALAEADCELEYWSQAGGAWERKARSPKEEAAGGGDA